MSSLVDLVEAAGRRVKYALLGALAVQAYVPYRYTHDVDVAVDKAHLWMLRDGLELRGYVMVENPRLGKLEFKHRDKGDIDVYTEEISGISVETLLRRAREGVIQGLRVSVVSPEDLILLKCRAGREGPLGRSSPVGG